MVIKAKASRAADMGSIPFRCRFFFSTSSHTSDLKIGTPVAAMPGAWRYRLAQCWNWSIGCQRTVGEIGKLINNFYLSVAARTIV